METLLSLSLLLSSGVLAWAFYHWLQAQDTAVEAEPVLIPIEVERHR